MPFADAVGVPPPPVTDRYKYLVAIAFIAGLFMDILDSTVINVALPTLGRQFDAGTDRLEWVVTGYLLSLAVWIPASGWIGDRFGTKKTFLFAMAVFTLGSALCGQARGINELIGFRLLQGVGGGMMTPVGTAMLFRAFGPAERAGAAAILSIPMLVAPLLGPVLGGSLVDGPGWRWIFYINLPVGILGFVFAFTVLKEHKEEQAGKFDLFGFVLSGAGLALVLYALSRGPSDGWGAANVIASGLAGVASLALAVSVELRQAHPMLHLRLLAGRMFRNANIAFFLQLASLLGLFFLLPLYLQELRGLTALQTGLTTLSQGISMGLCLPIVGRLYPRVGPRRLILGGVAIVAVTSACFLLVDLETSLWWIRGILFVRGAGIALAGVSVSTAVFSNIEGPSIGRATSLFRTNTQVASSFGVAVLGTVLISRTSSHVAALGQAADDVARRHASLLAYHDAFLVSALLGLAGFLFAFLIHDEDAAASMKQP
jgi:EmrB/QacA subfamily drug resistance transporter